MKLELVVGAAAVILDRKQKKILLTKRASWIPSFPNYWTFPAGRPDPTDKNIEATVVREVKEEVNLSFKPKKKFGFYESFPNSQRAISLIFLGEWKGKVKIQEDEISEYGWFTYDEIKKKNLPLAFAYSGVVEDLRKEKLF
jgi:ADP-ribose pyrophosphatase YjhB (NUDIX family)